MNAVARLALVVALAAATRGACAAQSLPSPAPSSSASPAPSSSASPAPAAAASPAPSPSPQAIGIIRVGVDAHVTFISQSTNGFGQLGCPESGLCQTPPLSQPNFIAGTSPAAPLTPYDTFASTPMTPGNAMETAVYLTPAYAGRAFDATLTLGVGAVTGSITNAVYWGENLIPGLNPHLGAQGLPYSIAFPTHAGQDDGSGFIGSVLGGTIATKDGSVALHGGWFDLTQSDQFVFVQPAYQSAIPSLAILPAESLGNGPPTADWWALNSGTYQLHGADLVAKAGLATFELTDANLPSLPGTGATLTLGSVVIDHGEGTRYSAEVEHVVIAGNPVPTTVAFAQGTIVDTSQGPLPFGTISGQHETIYGLRAAFHLFHLADAVAEWGHSVYDATGVTLPGTGAPGNYYHAGVTKTFGRSTASFDLYRNDPYYATAILPYGAPENVWSVAWSWPGQWLKSNYQLIDNYPVNVNRQGYRVKYRYAGGPFEVRASYANFGQIVPITLTNAQQTGFVDGFFLPQDDDAPTLGRQNQYAFWATWHAGVADVTVDWVEDAIRRPADPGHPQDTVDYVTPEYTLYASRRLTPYALVSLGYAQYFMKGEFSQSYENVNYGQREGFIGTELQETARTSTLVTLRRSSFAGYATVPSYPPPDFSGTLLILEQRLKF